MFSDDYSLHWDYKLEHPLEQTWKWDKRFRNLPRPTLVNGGLVYETKKAKRNDC